MGCRRGILVSYLIIFPTDLIRQGSSYAPEVPPLPDFLAGMSEKDTASTAKDKSEQDSRWIGDFSDDLTVAIALRKWEEAITLVEEGRQCVLKTGTSVY